MNFVKGNAVHARPDELVSGAARLREGDSGLAIQKQLAFSLYNEQYLPDVSSTAASRGSNHKDRS
ncbi:MAG: hypothetical protein WBP85_16405, partial [Terracidiphilus sp.]